MNFLSKPWVIPLLIIIVILLFGANKLPGLARNMGESMRIFKSEVEELRKDDDKKRPEDERDGASKASDRDQRDYDPRDDRTREEVRETRDDSYRRD